MTGTPVFERLWHDITSHLHHHDYHGAQQPAPLEGNMSLATFEADIRNGITEGMDKAAEVYNHLKGLAEQKLPEVADLAAKAAGNPLVNAAFAAVHLSPELLTTLADVIAKADAAIVAAGGAPAEPAAPAEAPAEQPAEAPAA